MKAQDFEMNDDFEEAYTPRKKEAKKPKGKPRRGFNDEESNDERGRKKHKIDKKNAPRASWKY